MTDLYVTDEKGRNVYYVYNLQTPFGSTIRTIRYDFDTKGHGIAFVARDCLDILGYKYKAKEPNKQIYKFVSKENIINRKDIETVSIHTNKVPYSTLSNQARCIDYFKWLL